MRKSVDDPRHWLARAEEMRALAAQANDLDAKASMLTVADEYEKLAGAPSTVRTGPATLNSNSGSRPSHLAASNKKQVAFFGKRERRIGPRVRQESVALAPMLEVVPCERCCGPTTSVTELQPLGQQPGHRVYYCEACKQFTWRTWHTKLEHEEREPTGTT